MLRIKKSIIDAIKYFHCHKDESITSISTKFNIDRHTLNKYIKIDISGAIFDGVDTYVIFDELEKCALKEYVENPEMSLLDIQKKYGYKSDTFKKKCEILNISIRKYTYTFNRDALKNIVTEEDAYILGFILADGYICDSRNELRIKLSARDEDILIKINNYLNSNVPIKHLKHTETGKNLSALNLSSKELVNTLHNYNLFSNKSQKEVFYRNIPFHLMRHYIRGIIDGDGYIRTNLKQIGCCGSKDVIEQIIINLKNILNLEIDVSTTLKYDESSNIYRCWFCGENAEKIINYLYCDSNIYLDRKYNLAKKYFN